MRRCWTIWLLVMGMGCGAGADSRAHKDAPQAPTVRVTAFNVRTADLKAINSMTKYPSIPTYHALDPRDGSLLEETIPFSGMVIGDEAGERAGPTTAMRRQ